MVEHYDFTDKNTRKIDPTKLFTTKLDLSFYVMKSGDNDFVCTKCFKVLVRIEPGGLLGAKLNQIDTAVILDHHLADHDPMKS